MRSKLEKTVHNTRFSKGFKGNSSQFVTLKTNIKLWSTQIFLWIGVFAIAYLFQQNPKQSLIMKSKNIIIVSQLN